MRWTNCLVRVRYCDILRHPLMIYRLNLAPVIVLFLSISCIVPFWTVTSVCVFFLLRLVLFRYIGVIAHVFCHAGVLVCLFVVIYCCGFWYDVMENGYRILNCIMHLSFLIFGFYLSLGIPKLLFKVILLQLLFYLFIPIWNSFVSVVIVIGFCLSEWYNRLCESWAGVR